LGLIAIRQAHWSQGAELLQKAVDANPRLPVAWNNLGVALYQLGRIEPAFNAWNHALELKPDLWDTLWNLGTKAAQHGFNKQASLALERFATGAPKDRYGDEIRMAQLFLAQLRRGVAAR
jgi:Flp pilus assembly protein TadD